MGGQSEPRRKFRYWAFISYSHADEAAAKWIHNRLETYRVPPQLLGKEGPDGPIPSQLKPVFRDREEFPSTHDLGEAIRGALNDTGYLLVLCSPHSARSDYVNEEIRHFKSKRGVERIHALILDGEPNASADQEECFPSALRYDVREDGTEVSCEAPIAADQRPGKDGRRLAFLKIAAGILGVGLDELVQREKQRQRRRRKITIFSAAAGLILGLTGWILLADADVAVPGGALVQNQLDSRGWTIFRPIEPERPYPELASDLRQRLIAHLDRRHAEEGRFAFSGEVEKSAGSWTTAQVLSALAAAPETSREDMDRIHAALARMFELYDEHAQDGQPGWPHSPGGPPQGCITLWMANALVRILPRSDLLTDANRAIVKSRLASMRNSVEQLYPLADGGWNMFGNPVDPALHQTYPTALALELMLNLHAADLPLPGGESSLEERIRESVTWLLEAYVADASPPGWTRQARDDDRVVYDGLTLQIYYLLLRAEEMGFASLDATLVGNITDHLLDCRERTLESPLMMAEFSSLVRVGPRELLQNEAVTFQWYPWALKCVVHWLRRLDQNPAPRLDEVRVRRTLKHLVEKIGSDYTEQLMEGYTYAPAELLYCLSDLQD